jgi:hypothetical protein
MGFGKLSRAVVVASPQSRNCPDPNANSRVRHPIFMGWTKFQFRSSFPTTRAACLPPRAQLAPKDIMSPKKQSPQLHPLILAATVATLLAGGSARAGDFTMTLLSGDADSGIQSGLSYTAVADFVGPGTRVVNGVSFNETGLTGTNYALTLANPGTAAAGSNVTGGVGDVVSEFFHGNGSPTASLTLSGLTVGTQYVTTWYNRTWGDNQSTGRVVNITPSDTGTPFRINQDSTRNGDGTVIRYAFTATATSITYDFNAVNLAAFHHYAMTNAVRNDSLLSYQHFTPIVPTITVISGMDVPFAVSNGDLLQTNLSGVTSTGNFNREPVLGDLSVLTNGAFAIGTGGNRPELVTGENNATITFTLDTSVNTLGYDVTSIAGYGGWGDGGRDNQIYSIFFSQVGSAAFTYLGGVNDRPGAPGAPSAISALFNNVGLTGVDAIRIDFLDGQDNGFAGYGEFDVNGTATVPEPSTAVALLGGVGLLLGLRRGRC